LKSALTVTVRDINRMFFWWVDYHKALFDELIIWLDDSTQWDRARSLRASNIHVYVGSQQESLVTSGWQGRAMLRQDINTNNAIELCRERDIDWLCHLDSDELLWASRDMLSGLWGCSQSQLIFVNHEVFPVWEAQNPFEECRVFKLNGRYPFNFYGNGKAAVRIKAALHGYGAHRFLTNSNTSMEIATAVVLHYSCATYDLWVQKYYTLGLFSNYWWDNPNSPINMPYHLASRDLLKVCRDEKSFEKALLAWSKQLVPPNELRELITLKAARIYDLAPTCGLTIRYPRA
jgi:hypothetical protein